MPKSKDRGDRGGGGGVDEIQWFEFDPSLIRFDDTVLLLGTRGSGKTLAARLILLSAGKPPVGLVQIGSPEGLKTWIDNLPIIYLHQSNEIDTERFQALMEPQAARAVEITKQCKKRKAKWKAKSIAKIQELQAAEEKQLLERAERKKYSVDKLRRKTLQLKAKYDQIKYEEGKKLQEKWQKLYDRLAVPDSCFLCFDDLGDEKKGVMDHKIMKQLFSTGRHYLALVIIICQYVKHLSTTCRSGVNWLFLWAGAYSPKEMDKIYDDYVPASIFPNKKLFWKAYRRITEEDTQNCIVIWRHNQVAKKAENRVFWWNPVKWMCRREDKVEFFGSSDYKLYSDLFYNGKSGLVGSAEVADKACKDFQRAERQKQKSTASSSSSSCVTGPTMTLPPTIAGAKREDLQKVMQEELQKAAETRPEQDLLANKQSEARWKRAEKLRQKRLRQP